MGAVDRALLPAASGAISRFFRRAKQFVHELILAGAMAFGGPGQLTREEIEAADAAAQRQNQYFDRFEREVQQNPPQEFVDPSSLPVQTIPPPMTAAELAARAEMYGNATWQTNINIGRDIAIKQGVFIAERRVHKLNEAQHRFCKTCIKQSQLGWQPMGTLLEIGDSECNGSCDCYYEWKDKDNRIHVSPSGRHNPKGYNLPGLPFTRLPGIAYPPDKGKAQPDVAPQEPGAQLPGTPGPPEKPKRPPKGKPPKPEPPQSLEDFLKEAGSPFPASEYDIYE